MKYEYEIQVGVPSGTDSEAVLDEIYSAVLDGPTIHVEAGQVQTEDGDDDSGSLTVLVSFEVIGNGDGEPGQTLRRLMELECVTSIESS